MLVQQQGIVPLILISFLPSFLAAVRRDCSHAAEQISLDSLSLYVCFSLQYFPRDFSIPTKQRRAEQKNKRSANESNPSIHQPAREFDISGSDKMHSDLQNWPHTMNAAVVDWFVNTKRHTHTQRMAYKIPEKQSMCLDGTHKKYLKCKLWDLFHPTNSTKCVDAQCIPKIPPRTTIRLSFY